MPETIDMCPDPAPSREMPRFRCIKQVWALQISGIQFHCGQASLVPSDPGFAPIPVTEEWFNKHQPVVGGYYVVYPGDGYASFSPKEAFEQGYLRMDGISPDEAIRAADSIHEVAYMLQRFAYLIRERDRNGPPMGQVGRGSSKEIEAIKASGRKG